MTSPPPISPVPRDARRSRRAALGTSLALAALALGCAGFDTSHEPRPGALERLSRLVVRGDFSRPQNLRPCCAFGHSLGVELAELPVPGIEVQNVIAADDPGSHTYDGGLVSLRNSAQRAFLNAEKNGLVFTCRGGFIDLAHVRDYADWTAFLALRLDALLHRGTLIDLGDEAGTRLVYVEAIEPETIDSLGRRRIAIELARWLAYQASIWHEVATWYGYAAIDLFPERASAFSPEDLYSNLTGIDLAAGVLSDPSLAREADFNRAMDRALAERLKQLGAVSPEHTVLAASAVDGRWWDSTARVPDMDLVLRRNFDLGQRVAPWQLPRELRPSALEAACRDTGHEAWTLEQPDRLGELVFAEHARFDVRVDRSRLDEDFPSTDDSPWITQQSLPRIVARVRAANRERYGDDADRP